MSYYYFSDFRLQRYFLDMFNYVQYCSSMRTLFNILPYVFHVPLVMEMVLSILASHNILF